MHSNNGFEDHQFDVDVLSDEDFDHVSGGQRVGTGNTLSTDTACYVDGITDYNDPK